MMTRNGFIALVALGICTGCSSSSEERAPVPLQTKPTPKPDERICLVLSVGGPGGVAHLGAIEALRDAKVRIDCVAGTSMGAVIGALYASAPSADTTGRYVDFAKAYLKNTVTAGGDGAAAGALLGAMGGVLMAGMTGGASLGLMAVGAAAGGGSVSRVDYARFVQTLDGALGSMNIEDVGLPFGYHTYHVQLDSKDLSVVPAKAGKLAEAVGRSVANPLLFRELQPTKTGVLDPGVDRVSSTPIDDTCDALPHNAGPHGTHFTLIAINVSGRPAYYRDARCRVVEVPVTVDDVSAETAYKFGPKFERALGTGYEETCKALSAAALPRCKSPKRTAEPSGPLAYVVEIINAHISPTKPDGRLWDAAGDGTELPDARLAVRIQGSGAGQFRTGTAKDTLTPRWNETSTVSIARGDVLNLELVDQDVLADDPIGSTQVVFAGAKMYEADFDDSQTQVRFRISPASE